MDTFHTRHDFTPELGWAAFQLIGGFSSEGVADGELEFAAKALASPLSRRSDLGKLLRTLEELRLVSRAGNATRLSGVGSALLQSVGRYETGFCAAVHCLYSWLWLLDGETVATPSWSYRQVCRAIREAGAVGIEPDAVVLKVINAAGRFGAERVSFSRSSVSGVTNWLKSHSPPLVESARGRLFPTSHLRPGLTAVRFHSAALCAVRGGAADLDEEASGWLADSLLLPPHELPWVLRDALADSPDFHLLKEGKRLVARESGDPFIHWICHECKRSA